MRIRLHKSGACVCVCRNTELGKNKKYCLMQNDLYHLKAVNFEKL